MNELLVDCCNQFNPIACGNHAHLGTKLAILIAYFIGVETKQQSNLFSLLIIIIKEPKQEQQIVVFLFQLNIIFSQ